MDQISQEEKQRHYTKAVNGNYPGAFLWWASRYRGNMYPYRCPGCDEYIQLRQRVTQKDRVCPGCGHIITLRAIDNQLDSLENERQKIISLPPESGCLILFAALLTGLFSIVFIATLFFA